MTVIHGKSSRRRAPMEHEGALPRNTARRAEPLREITQAVYFLRTDGLIKIGHTADPVRRFYHFPGFVWTDLLAIVAADRSYEQALHHRFRHLLVRGQEYFSPDPEVFDVINQIRSDAGVETVEP